MAQKIRLQKFIADAGVTSRRKAEALIEAGKVRVNGAVAEIGCTVDPKSDVVSVNGKKLLIDGGNYSICENASKNCLCGMLNKTEKSSCKE